MTSYVLTRAGYSVFVLWGALTIIFVAIRIVPGDPASLMLGAGATEEDVAALRERLGLDDSLPVQYVRFVGDALRLDFGESLWLNRPVGEEVAGRIAATSRLAITAVVLALLVSFPLGILAALRQQTPLDGAISVLSLIGQSVPSFWLGIMLILLFARQLRWLPSAGSESWRHLILPAFTLSLPLIGVLTRLVRSGLLEVMYEDYIRTARAKGLYEKRVVLRHAFRNALIPLTTIVALNFGAVIGGALVTETIFALDGMGLYFINALGAGDPYPIMAWLMVTATMIIVGNLCADIALGYLDPRIRMIR